MRTRSQIYVNTGFQSGFANIYTVALGFAILPTSQLGVPFLMLALASRSFQSDPKIFSMQTVFEQSWLNFAYFSDLVRQVNISFTFDINLWHMIGVRASALPHGLARIRRKTTLLRAPG